MKILIGYDGSDCADSALEDLKRAGLPDEAEALVVSVAERWLPPPPPSSYEMVAETFAQDAFGGVIESNRQTSQGFEDAYNRAFQARSVVHALFPHWKVSSEAYSGSPAREILRRAEEYRANLIVVGSLGRSALGRLFPGSVSQRVVTGASCSVRIARPHMKEKESPVCIIIGVDGSPGSQIAVREVAGRNWPKNSEVRLVTSVDPLHMYALAPDEKFAIARSIYQAAEPSLREAGLQVVSLIQEEDPKLFLIAEAERCRADSIFVGARGLNRVERLLLGSISTAVVSRAPCSVEVVRRQ